MADFQNCQVQNESSAASSRLDASLELQSLISVFGKSTSRENGHELYTSENLAGCGKSINVNASVVTTQELAPKSAHTYNRLTDKDWFAQVFRSLEAGDLPERLKAAMSFNGCSELLRGVPLASVLRSGGWILSSSKRSEQTYNLSKRVTQIDVFLSHNWSVPRWKKYIALVFYFHTKLATACWMLCMFLAAMGTYRSAMSSESSDVRLSTHVFFCTLLSLPCLLLTFFFICEVFSRLGCKGPTIFMDNLCIHYESDEDLHQQGMAKFSAFTWMADRMLALYTDAYLQHLWTSYELASFLLLKPVSRLDLLHVAQPLAFSGILIFLYLLQVLALLYETFDYAKYASLILMVFTFGALSFAMRSWARTRNTIHTTLSNYDVYECICSSQEEKSTLFANIADLMRAVGVVNSTACEENALLAFNIYVREMLPKPLASSFSYRAFKMKHYLLIGLFLSAPSKIDYAVAQMAHKNLSVNGAIIVILEVLVETTSCIPLMVFLLENLSASCVRLKGLLAGLVTLLISVIMTTVAAVAALEGGAFVDKLFNDDFIGRLCAILLTWLILGFLTCLCGPSDVLPKAIDDALGPTFKRIRDTISGSPSRRASTGTTMAGMASMSSITKAARTSVSEYMPSFRTAGSTDSLETSLSRCQYQNVPVRFVPLSDLIKLGRLPRFGSNTAFKHPVTGEANGNYCKEKAYFEHDRTLFVFVSHRWDRPGFGPQGHPDTEDAHKCKLITKASMAMVGDNALVPPDFTVALWIDYCCIDQDGAPASELDNLDGIMACCDIMLTPVVDPEHHLWEFPPEIQDLFEAYGADAWQEYWNRAWCRVEAMFAAVIPVPKAKAENFNHTLRNAFLLGRRPHFLFGTKELDTFRPPRSVPPLLNSHFDAYAPEKGELTKEADRPLIAKLTRRARKHVTNVEEEYGGDRDTEGNPHGYGKYTWSDGAIYEGEWCHGEMDGTGKYTYPDLRCYEGGFKGNMKNGRGKFFFADGGVHEGEWTDDRRKGEGELVYPDGQTMYKGQYENDKRHGHGMMIFADGRPPCIGRWKSGKFVSEENGKENGSSPPPSPANSEMRHSTSQKMQRLSSTGKTAAIAEPLIPQIEEADSPQGSVASEIRNNAKLKKDHREAPPKEPDEASECPNEDEWISYQFYERKGHIWRI